MLIFPGGESAIPGDPRRGEKPGDPRPSPSYIYGRPYRIAYDYGRPLCNANLSVIERLHWPGKLVFKRRTTH